LIVLDEEKHGAFFCCTSTPKLSNWNAGICSWFAELQIDVELLCFLSSIATRLVTSDDPIRSVSPGRGLHSQTVTRFAQRNRLSSEELSSERWNIPRVNASRGSATWARSRSPLHAQPGTSIIPFTPNTNSPKLGEIPPELGNLSELVSLWLNDNQFEGKRACPNVYVA